MFSGSVFLKCYHVVIHKAALGIHCARLSSSCAQHLLVERRSCCSLLQPRKLPPVSWHSPLRRTLVCRAQQCCLKVTVMMAKAPRGKESQTEACGRHCYLQMPESQGSPWAVEDRYSEIKLASVSICPQEKPTMVGVIRRKVCLLECVMLNLKNETLSPHP